MSNRASKSSNKKADDKPILHTNLDVSHTDRSATSPSRNPLSSPNTTSTARHDGITTLTRETQSASSTSTVETPIDWEQIIDREFQALDIDADGYVSIADMQSVLKNFAHLCNSHEIMRRIFEELDRNHDQRISRQEFQLYKNILIERENRFHRSSFEEKLDTIFLLFDRDQDNYISPQEIRETMQNLGEHIDDDLIDEMMQTADTNQDGRISREEFKRLLLQLHPHE